MAAPEREARDRVGRASSSTDRAWPIAAIGAIAGLAASSALLADRLLRSSFCSAGGGCDRVAQSEWARVLGVPRVYLGVPLFLALLVYVLVDRRPRGRGATVAIAIAGLALALEGVHHLAVQAFVLGAFCPFCVVVDLAAIAAGVAIARDATRSRDQAPRRRGRVLVAATALVALAVPFAFAARPRASSAVAPVVPLEGDGPLLLREYIDLECPFCRRTHVALKKALSSRPDVILERRHVPLSFHPHAESAAVAACCAAEQGAEDRFIDAVVATSAPPNDATCRAAAVAIGLDLARYDACRGSPAPRRRIEADQAAATLAKVEGLPTIEIGTERHVGALDDARAVALLARHPPRGAR
jgi:uncharacterized membrane protein/predicted DsbA family dithiol-disulfide isomerase